ncbi:MAG TPA: hypothetical protein VL092_05910 [Chitinophagaceae bacterium]|nr:hypothetical protein [Chitinophagaceae bacterium]
MKALLFASVLLCTATACNRKENDQTAGKGGNATLICVPKHHDVSKNILNGKIYIAYNVQDIPSSYNDSADCVMVDGVPTATLSGLKAGKYYLYGTGFDTSISKAVKGGLSYEIKQETSLQITVPVTETHL